jgi:hypothetical protein
LKQSSALVLQYAQSLGIHERYLRELADAAHQRLHEALADMTQADMASILNRPWQDGDVDAWLLPYQGSAGDPALGRRFENLSQLAPATFGHAFWKHSKKNSYAFPGEPQGLNAAFSVPHDSVHVLTGYGTNGRGEILVSTFTASMHRNYPMAGHVLPAIFSWNLNVEINSVAKNASAALDPVAVWRAWSAGAQASIDTFAQIGIFGHIRANRSPYCVKVGRSHPPGSKPFHEPRSCLDRRSGTGAEIALANGATQS